MCVRIFFKIINSNYGTTSVFERVYHFFLLATKTNNKTTLTSNELHLNYNISRQSILLSNYSKLQIHPQIFYSTRPIYHSNLEQLI